MSIIAIRKVKSGWCWQAGNAHQGGFNTAKLAREAGRKALRQGWIRWA